MDAATPGKFDEALRQHENRLAKMTERHEKERKASLDALTAYVETPLKAACDYLGLTFTTDGQKWRLNFVEPPDTARSESWFKVKNVSTIQLLETLEPELLEMLWAEVGSTKTLGVFVKDYSPTVEYEWVVIEVDKWFRNRQVAPPNILTQPISPKEGMVYFGTVSKQLAEAVVERFNQDWDEGSRLLGLLPWLDYSSALEN